MMKWQIGVTPGHWEYEVWLNGARVPDAIAVDSVGRAIVMRYGERGCERDGLDRIKADIRIGRVELRRTNPSPNCRDSETTSPEPFDVVVCQTDEVIRVGRDRPTLKAS